MGVGGERREVRALPQGCVMGRAGGGLAGRCGDPRPLGSGVGSRGTGLGGLHLLAHLEVLGLEPVGGKGEGC